MKKIFGKSWETTAGGFIAGMSMIFNEVQKITDQDVMTNPDWNIIVAGLAIAVGFYRARDNNKSSESAGGK